MLKTVIFGGLSPAPGGDWESEGSPWKITVGSSIFALQLRGPTGQITLSSSRTMTIKRIRLTPPPP